MKLSEFFQKDVLLRDAEFDRIGLMMSRPEKRMLTFSNADDLPELKENADVSAVICSPAVIDLVDGLKLGIAVASEPRQCIANLHNELCMDGGDILGRALRQR